MLTFAGESTTYPSAFRTTWRRGSTSSCAFRFRAQ